MQSWRDCSTRWWRRRQDPHCPHSLFHSGNLKTEHQEGKCYLDSTRIVTTCKYMACTIFGVVNEDHLFQRWHDQPMVCHWAVRMSWPHENRCHWIPQPPTSLGALCGTHANMSDETIVPVKTLQLESQRYIRWSDHKRAALNTLRYNRRGPFWHFCRWNKNISLC